MECREEENGSYSTDGRRWQEEGGRCTTACCAQHTSMIIHNILLYICIAKACYALGNTDKLSPTPSGPQVSGAGMQILYAA